MHSDPAARNHRQLELRYDTIARRAAALWEYYGRPKGRDVEIWLDAESSLRDEEEFRQALNDTEPDAAVTANSELETASGHGRFPMRHQGDSE